MSIGVCRLQGIRNYAEAEFRPSGGVTLVWGPNGSGKSTLLEAIGLFSTLSSPRSGHLGALISHGAAEAGARLEPSSGSILDIRLRGGRAHLRAGGSGVQARDFLGRFRSVGFGPEDLDLVRGEPELRRRATDDLVVQLRPSYRAVRQEYERALRQRNSALRQGLGDQARVYHAPLAAAAAEVLTSRRNVVEHLRPHVAVLYEELAGSGSLDVRYRSSVQDLDGDLLSRLLEAYEANLAVELERGTTRIGPHRDDLEIALDGHAARTFASRGEQRTAALALRLAELRLLEGGVLLLDDVMSELDPDRCRRVFKVVDGVQTVVTATESDVVTGLADLGGVWKVEEGRLRELD